MSLSNSLPSTQSLINCLTQITQSSSSVQSRQNRATDSFGITFPRTPSPVKKVFSNRRKTGKKDDMCHLAIDCGANADKLLTCKKPFRSCVFICSMIRGGATLLKNKTIRYYYPRSQVFLLVKNRVITKTFQSFQCNFEIY